MSFFLVQAWAEEVSEVLDLLRDWVYLHPDVPRSRAGQQQHAAGRRDQSEQPETADVPHEEGDGPAWTRGEEHVQEWAEFLWRVARPGVMVDFPLELEGRTIRRRAHA